MGVTRLDIERIDGFVTAEECCDATTTTSTTRWSQNPDLCCTTTTLPDCNLDGYARTPEACLEGLVIETIYLHVFSDIPLMPIEYEHPCPATIGTHTCNRACFEVYGNGVYVGDSLLNNFGGTGGLPTAGGNLICEDYLNTPAPITGGVWTGSAISRYSAITIDAATALAIAAAGGGGTTINFSLVSAMTTYGQACNSNPLPHTNVTWVRITNAAGDIYYNGCPEGNFLSLDVCSTPPTTTTTTTIAPTTMVEFNSNETGIVINPLGTANPYPVTFTVSGIVSNTSRVELVIEDLSHTTIGDVAMCLVAPNSSYNCMISGNRGGNTPVVNLDVTFTSTVGTVWDGVSSGTFNTPTYPLYDEYFTAPAPTYLISATYPAIGIFSNMVPGDVNGTWSFYIQDLFAGDGGTLASAKLRIYT